MSIVSDKLLNILSYILYLKQRILLILAKNMSFGIDKYFILGYNSYTHQ